MAETVRRLVWFAVVATIASFVIFVVLGNYAMLGTQSAGPVTIHDSISPGVHRLNGILVLPLSCDELTVETQKISATEYLLAFTTWQDPAVDCPRTPTPRAFNAVAFAPAVGVDFVATLDGKPFDISVIADTTSIDQP